MLERIGTIIEKLFGPLGDRIADRIAAHLESKLPDLSDLDEQIVAKLPDLSHLPDQVAEAVTEVIGIIPNLVTRLIPGGKAPVVDDILGAIGNIFGKGKP